MQFNTSKVGAKEISNTENEIRQMSAIFRTNPVIGARHYWLSLLLLCSCLLASVAQPSSIDAKGRYITVKGFLLTETRWGPPNFGENPSEDSKLTIYVIKTDRVLRVKRDQGDIDIDTIQLDFPVTPSYKRLVGKRVEIKGQLIDAATPLQYTAVVIDAESVTVLSR